MSTSLNRLAILLHYYTRIYVHYWIFHQCLNTLIQTSLHIHAYTYIYNSPIGVPIDINMLAYHHHHDVIPLERISLILSRHFSLSFIASGRSSGLYPVSSHSCYMYVRAGRPDFAWPYAGAHRSTSLMSSSLLLQQCPAYLVRLTCIVFVIGDRRPYSCCLLGFCR